MRTTNVELLLELAKSNPILQQLLDDWIEAKSFSFWRFFTNQKTLIQWDALLRNICKKHHATSLEMYKSDVAGMIIVLDTCVVRTYRTSRFLKIRPLYRLRSPYLEKCLESKQLPHIGVFVCKKIQPLVTMDMELSMNFTKKLTEQMDHDVHLAISKMHSYGYCHNDVSIDNTGYDKETNKFVVFDFDAASRHTTKDGTHICKTRDEDSWKRSLHTWSLQMEETAQSPLWA